MTRYSGKNMYFRFVTSAGGTIAPSADYRTWTVDDSADEIDASAGADTYKVFLAGQSARTGNFTYLMSTAASTPSGTTLFAQLSPQTEGTIFWGPEGTASGKVKYSAAAVILGRSMSVPYNGVVECTVNFRLNAADTVATW